MKIDRKLQKQIEKLTERLHESWIQAITETHGIGPKRLEEIMRRREEIARKIYYKG